MAYRGVEGSAERGVDGKVFPPATDLNRWSLEVCEGRQFWRYLNEGEERPDPVASAYHLGQNVSDFNKVVRKSDTVEDSLRAAVQYFGALQTQDGHWAGDYDGPMFLLPGYVITCHITRTPIPTEQRLEIIRYLSNVQLDGGWGIHTESLPTVFGTALNYVVLRLLGVPKTDARLTMARDWLSERGGCLGIPSWGKFWLAILNVYQWEGVHSLFPEMILLPQWFPLHTHRLWSYCRTVYMPMSFLYGMKFQAEVSPLILDLREELIFEPYDKVNWVKARDFIHEGDLYTPHTMLLNLFFSITNTYEVIAPSFLRKRALDWLYEVMRKEDEFTNYICIGPVNKVMNLLCVYLREGRDCDAFRRHVDRLKDYLWMGRNGFKMNGTNGSQLWDTSFMVQALIESGMKDEFSEIFRKAHDYVDVAQIRVNHPNHKHYYRDETKGGWPFSTRDIGWVVADCTGEGLKASLICKRHGFTETPLSDDRLFDAMNILLLMQNTTGGYATCEKTRGYHFFEYFNASEVFGEIMIDYDYVECTSSAMQAMCLFREMYPDHRTMEVNSAIKAAVKFMLSIQKSDGSWEGMWGICFTYGIWFALDGLLEAGLPTDHPAIQRACAFLVSKQKQDGGWGETFESCVQRTYVQHPRSQVVNTAWAVLSLLKANYKNKKVMQRGVELLIERQQEDGNWLQESISGVFNKNCMINYSNYKNIFPIWAIGRFRQQCPELC